jgi:hypothetical protein
LVDLMVAKRPWLTLTRPSLKARIAAATSIFAGSSVALGT